MCKCICIYIQETFIHPYIRNTYVKVEESENSFVSQYIQHISRQSTHYRQPMHFPLAQHLHRFEKATNNTLTVYTNIYNTRIENKTWHLEMYLSLFFLKIHSYTCNFVTCEKLIKKSMIKNYSIIKSFSNIMFLFFKHGKTFVFGKLQYANIKFVTKYAHTAQRS